MDYIGNIIRPPSEANSIILQVTVGCSHNKCTFCGAYKEKRFAIKSDETINKDILFAKTYCGRQHKVFLADGDALILPYPRLRQLLVSIRENLKQVTRISLYGSCRSIRSKSLDELKALKELGLDRVYLGLESGCDTILSEINKGETTASMISAADKIRSAGLFLSVTALLGIGQLKHSADHARKTASALTMMKPNQIGILTLIPLDNTPLGQNVVSGSFALPGPAELLSELRMIIEGIDCKTQVHANHASNYLPITGRLPRDRQRLLDEIDDALTGTRTLTPEEFRGL